ncbi:hypothetical protein D3C81_1386700 [compost metagenome]
MKAMRSSPRASWLPTHTCGPKAKATWRRAFCRTGSKSSGFSNTAGSRLAAPHISCTMEPAGTATPPISVSWVARRNRPWIGASRRNTSSMKLGISAGSLRSCSSRPGVRMILSSAAVMVAEVVS